MSAHAARSGGGREKKMKERILNYMAYIDRLLLEDQKDRDLDYEALMKKHRTQLDFFMHERLVHLLVTLTFAILAFGDFFLLVVSFQPGLVALFVALMILLVPYIMHYYLLENGVQKMYRQYDEMQRRLEEKQGSGSVLPVLQEDAKKQKS